MNRKPNLAIVGATGLVGQHIFKGTRRKEFSF